jgi:large subunit ribosomal protein L30
MTKLLITYKKSTIGYAENQKQTVRSLGLRKLHQQVLQPDNQAVRGMLFTVRHLVSFEEVADDYALPVRQAHPRPTVVRSADAANAAGTPSPIAVTTPAVESTAEFEGVAERQGFAPAALTVPPAESTAEFEGPTADDDEVVGVAQDTNDVATVRADELELIEGIGPVIAELLREHGVTTFAQLAAMDAAAIQALLNTQPTLRLADPETWPEQASLLAAGRREEFDALVARLKGGRIV